MTVKIKAVTKYDVLKLVREYLEVDNELALATFRCGVSPNLIRRHGEILERLRILINAELHAND